MIIVAKRILKAVLSILFILVAVSTGFFSPILVGITISGWESAEERALWPTAQGMILSFQTDSNNPDLPRNYLLISYRYEVDGMTYFGSQEMSYDDIEEPAAYTPERWVQVHYDPRNYARSVVEIDGHSGREDVIDVIIIFALFLFTPLAGFGAFRLARWRKWI